MFLMENIRFSIFDFRFSSLAETSTISVSQFILSNFRFFFRSRFYFFWCFGSLGGGQQHAECFYGVTWTEWGPWECTPEATCVFILFTTVLTWKERMASSFYRFYLFFSLMKFPFHSIFRGSKRGIKKGGKWWV